MDKNVKVINYLCSTDKSGAFFIDWLSQNGSTTEALTDIVWDPEDFARLLLYEIHECAERLLRHEKPPETPHRKEQLPKNVSPKKSNTPRAAQNRPRLQLFQSPQKSDVPRTPGSTPRKTSTPANSTDSFASPLSWNRFRNRSCDDGDFSPVSPSWHNRSLQDDPRNRSRSKFSLGDFMMKDSTPKKKGRRIKPTQVSTHSHKTSSLDGSPFSVPPESPGKNPLDRKSLKRDCDDVLSRIKEFSLTSPDNSTDNSSLFSPPNANSSPLRKDINEVIPPSPISPAASFPKFVSSPSLTFTLDTISNQDVLKKLAEIYFFLLEQNYCENLMTEIYLLLNLLVVTEPSGQELIPPLDSLENGVFFAAKCIEFLGDYFLLLSSTTLSLLASSAIRVFAPEFTIALAEACSKKTVTPRFFTAECKSANVSFQCDTDNLENFTSHVSFTAFRKQRDGLYHLMQKWEECHNLSGWDFAVTLGKKVRNILALRDDPTNLMHFARLFRNQLLASCSVHSPTLDDAGRSVLELLPSTNRERLVLLEARMSKAPVKRRGPTPGPDFPGRQAFFRDFIKASDSSVFLNFLQMSLLDELLKLNESEFTCEANDGFADDMTVGRYFECVSSCCLLAKFLAFVEFLPYEGSAHYSEQILDLYKTMRNKVPPILDTASILNDALKNGRLILTVPWISSYLILMDKVSATLPVHAETWDLLLKLSRNVPKKITPTGKLMIVLCIGWLRSVAPLPGNLSGNVALPKTDFTHCTLDMMKVVTETVLYHVCPYLEELNLVLNGVGGAQQARHVRPTPTSPKDEPEEKHLQLKLEENFLRNQSSSTKRSIQFVVERVASCCVKEISAERLPAMREKVNLDEGFEEWRCRAKKESVSAAWEICTDRTRRALTALLGRDVPEAAINVAVEIATRQAVENALSWLNSHTLTDASLKDLARNPTKIGPKTEEIPWDPSHLGSDCIAALRRANCLALKHQLSETDFIDVVNLARKAVDQQCFPLTSERGVFCLLSDLVVWSFSFCASVKMEPLLLLIRELGERHPSGPLERLFCPRNLHIVKNASVLCDLAGILIDSGVLSEGHVIQQARKCISSGASKELLETLEIFLSKAMKCPKGENEPTIS